MKHIWIVMIVIFDSLWIVSAIFDIIRSIKECEKEDYESIWEMILDISEDIEDSSRICLFANILGLFITSFLVWL